MVHYMLSELCTYSCSVSSPDSVYCEPSDKHWKRKNKLEQER